jgi:hypothetical protein
MGKLIVAAVRVLLAAFFMLIVLSVFLTKPDVAFAVGSDGVWVQVPNMLNTHCLGGAILLDNGEVLVTPGQQYPVAREAGNSARLHDGRVMVAGGEGPWRVPGNTAEIYDANTGQWTLTTPMLYGWFGGASMTVLHDGRVLVAGGSDGSAERLTAMIYDPAANT